MKQKKFKDQRGKHNHTRLRQANAVDRKIAIEKK